MYDEADKVEPDDEDEDDELLELELITLVHRMEVIDEIEYADMDEDEDELLAVIQVLADNEQTDEVIDDILEDEIQHITNADLMQLIIDDEDEVEYVTLLCADEMVVNE